MNSTVGANEAYEQYAEFPEVGSEPGANSGATGDAADKRGYQNTIFPNDSVTHCSGFINEIRSHVSGEKTHYFVRVGIIQGSSQGEEGRWEGDITNCDLLVGSTLRKWVESMIGVQNPMKGVRLRFVIRNLRFIPGIHEGKPVLNNRGILETISVGHIDQ